MGTPLRFSCLALESFLLFEFVDRINLHLFHVDLRKYSIFICFSFSYNSGKFFKDVFLVQPRFRSFILLERSQAKGFIKSDQHVGFAILVEASLRQKTLTPSKLISIRRQQMLNQPSKRHLLGIFPDHIFNHIFFLNHLVFQMRSLCFQT